MKRFFILASAAIVALASCAKTEVVYDKQHPQEIAFRQITGSMTKAGTELDHSINLGVFANQNADNTIYFGNTEFTFNTSSWAGGRYWPFDGRALDFTVYAPYVAGATYEAGTRKLVIPSVTADEVHYYGKELYRNKTKENDPLPVVLQHASAKIQVVLKGTAVFTVTDLNLNNVTTTGTIDVSYAETGSLSSVATSTVTASNNHDFVTSDVALAPDNATALTSVCYVLPGTQTNFTIKFDQATGSNNEKISYERTIDLSANGNWDANKQYIYTIDITADEILITADVDDWGTETSYSPAVPKN